MTALIILITTLILIIALYIFLIAPRMYSKPDRSGLLGYHYAHRGLFDNNSDAPENSIKAFKLAINSEYGIELDVQLSKDGVPVVFHDATLTRMCGVKGYVWEYTLDELKKFQLADSSQTIPTFREALATINGRVPIIIEYKLYTASSRVCKLSSALLAGYKGKYCIESFHPLALMWYKKHQPEIIRGQLCMEYWKEDKYKGQLLYMLLSYLVTNVVTRPDFIAYKHSDADNISRRICRKLGALSVAWTIKSEKDFQDAKDKFDLFIFDSCRL